jgi:hypothetical protein
MTPQSNHHFNISTVLTKPDRLPEIIFVKIWNRSDQIQTNLPFGTVAVRPNFKRGLKINIPNKKNFTLQVNQFPMVCAFSLVIDKMQGITLQNIILGPLREGRQAPKTALYTALSRSNTLSGIHLLNELCPADFDYFVPSNDVLTEINRLSALELV